MKVGVILPAFASGPSTFMRVAAEAEEAGLDGVFAYDHLWPMGHPDRPALAPFPVLAAVATATERVHVGTLAARIGLVPDEVLIDEFLTLAAIAPGRVTAAIGVGDAQSRAENEAYAIPFAPRGERIDSLRRVVGALTGEIEIWIAGSSAAMIALAAELGVAVNLWDRPLGEVAAAASSVPVTWAGPAEHFDAGLDRAGARWGVVPVFAPGNLPRWSSAG